MKFFAGVLVYLLTMKVLLNDPWGFESQVLKDTG